MSDYCFCCGKTIPEGRIVCVECEEKERDKSSRFEELRAALNHIAEKSGRHLTGEKHR